MPATSCPSEAIFRYGSVGLVSISSGWPLQIVIGLDQFFGQTTRVSGSAGHTCSRPEKDLRRVTAWMLARTRTNRRIPDKIIAPACEP